MTTIQEASESIWLQVNEEDRRRMRDGRVVDRDNFVLGVFVDYHTFYKELLTDPARGGNDIFRYDGSDMKVQTICGYPLYLVQQRGTPLEPPVLVVFK